MKKLLLFLFTIMTTANGFGQFYSYFYYPSSVDLFGLCEISFTIPKTYSNPYDPDTICVYADFTGPDNSTYRVDGFYYEDYTFQQHNDGYEVATHNSLSDGWRIRFTPSQVGTWTFVIRAFDVDGSINLPFMNVNQTFSCTSVINADGFISKANSKFLKRDVVRKGQRQYHSFFPIGPNVAWYYNKTYCEIDKPLGIYYYRDHVDSLYNNANYMRVWTNRYQHASLYGPEYALNGNNTIVYFDSTLNQKDAAEIDYIISYANQHDIAIMLSFFNQCDFITSGDGCNPSRWENNPYNTILNLQDPCDFFTVPDAIRITKNLIRHIVSRWGYATNIMCWELWNEVEHSTGLCDGNIDVINHNIEAWHNEMSFYIRSIDPWGRCISSSGGNYLYTGIFQDLDIIQHHNYQDIQIALSRYEIPYSLFVTTKYQQTLSAPKLAFIGEYGFDNSKPPYIMEKDPKGVSMHNSLWSSMFSTTIGPASFWWWSYLDTCGMYKRFTPIKTFCQKLPILSETFTPHSTAIDHINVLEFQNGLRTYYMKNGSEDTIMGWSQDTAFAYQSLRRLTDSVRLQNDTLVDNTILPANYFVDDVPYDTCGYLYTLDPLKRPQPSSNDNTIILPITNQPVGSRYKVNWYDSETGNKYNLGTVDYILVQQNAQGNKYLSLKFPSLVRDLRKNVINNTFGDAVFVLTLNNPQIKEQNSKTE